MPYTESDWDLLENENWGISSEEIRDSDADYFIWTCPKCKKDMDYREKHYHVCKR